MTSVNVGGVNIFYEVMGQGAPLVMIQGFGQNSLQWGPIPAELAKQYKVILVDNRGTGRSDKPDSPMTIPMLADDVAHVLDALSISKASIFGVSMGGLISQRFAINHPDRVINLVLGCTFPSGPHHVQAPADGIRVLFDFEYLKNMTPEQRTMEVFRFMCSEKYIDAHPEAYKAYHEATVGYPTPTRMFKQQGGAIGKEDTWQELPLISVPTLLITGTADRMVPHQNSENLAKRIPGAELVLLPDMRHGFYIEAMGETINAIKAFIKRNKPA